MTMSDSLGAGTPLAADTEGSPDTGSVRPAPVKETGRQTDSSSAVGGGAHPGGEIRGAALHLPRGVPLPRAERINAATERRWRRALQLISADGCQKYVYDVGCCCVNPELCNQDWCLPCVAHLALDPSAPAGAYSATRRRLAEQIEATRYGGEVADDE